MIAGIFALVVPLYQFFIATPSPSKADLLLVIPYSSTVPVITLTDAGFSPARLDSGRRVVGKHRQQQQHKH